MATTTLDHIQEEALQAIAARSLAKCARVARQASRGAMTTGRGADWPQLKIAVLRDFTIEPLLPILTTFLASRGVLATFEVNLLGAITQDILDPGSLLYKELFQQILVASIAANPLGVPTDTQLDQKAILLHLLNNHSASVLAFNAPIYSAALMSTWQTHSPASMRYELERKNAALAELAADQRNLFICDLDRICRDTGRSQFWSPRDWALNMQPWSTAAMFGVAEEISHVMLLPTSPQIKCIVLDCDNTLWGGIVGEVGLNGIDLGETYPGTCYAALQEQLKVLSKQGYILALNSKNNFDDVRNVFQNHPRCRLEWSDFAAVRVNWQDKATNLKELASELNIGLSSLLFIDDSDVELSWVAGQLPEAQTLQIPSNPWGIPELLPRCRLLDRVRLTDEDQAKARMYSVEQQRSELRSSIQSFEKFVQSLNLQLTVEQFDPTQHLDRAVQLTQKTNQFNLTTRRYQPGDLIDLHRDGALLYLASLTDRFGDYGRIALAIFCPSTDPTTVIMDTFLMSCRAMGRTVEQMFLSRCLEELRRLGYSQVEAAYIPSQKNSPAATFLEEFPGSVGIPSNNDTVRYIIAIDHDEVHYKVNSTSRNAA